MGSPKKKVKHAEEAAKQQFDLSSIVMPPARETTPERMCLTIRLSQEPRARNTDESAPSGDANSPALF